MIDVTTEEIVNWNPPMQVFRCSLWMMHFGHSCPKRTVLWSSNAKVKYFGTGKLTAKFKKMQRRVNGHVRPVNKRIDKKTGKASYSGNSLLKATQNFGSI